MEMRYYAPMATIQVRDVPEQTHVTLRRRAADAGKSLQEYLLDVLNDIAAKPSVEEVLRRAGGRAGGRVGLGYASRAVRADRNRR